MSRTEPVPSRRRPDGPEARRGRPQPRSRSSPGSKRRPRGGPARRLPRVRPDRLRVRFEGRGRARSPSRSTAPRSSPSPRSAGGSASGRSSGSWNRTATGCINACALVGPDGPVATYRKVHLPFLGRRPLRRPRRPPVRGPRRRGAQGRDAHLLRRRVPRDGPGAHAARAPNCSSCRRTGRPIPRCAAEHMMATRAMENVVYAMAVNRVGEERGFRFIGRSSIAATNGQVARLRQPRRARRPFTPTSTPPGPARSA